MKITLKTLSVLLVSFIVYIILCAGEYTFLVHVMKITFKEILSASYNLIIVGMMSFLVSLSLHQEKL